MTTSFRDSQTIMPETHFEPRRYRVTYECERCGKSFARVYKSVPAHDPPCPRFECREAVAVEAKDREIARLNAMLESQQPPALIGANNAVKAVDATADIVMQDYSLTDLKDNIRQGEAVAPSLPPQQQKMADAYFGGGTAKVPDFATNQMRPVNKRQMDLVGRRAMAGAYRSMAVNQKMVTPTAVEGSSPLTVVRTEQIRGR